MALRAAATVILLRDGDGGLETFLLRRATTMAFAPRMHVFPGGRVDTADYEAQVDFTVADGAVVALAERASTDVAGLRALYSCAVREVLEETGIRLPAITGSGALLVDPAILPVADHWVTPDVESKRYDVRFFVAAVPAGQEAGLRTTEAEEAFWISPRDALTGRREGSVAMLPPTQATLAWAADFSSAHQALLAAAQRPVVPLLPKRLADEHGTVRWALVHDRTGEVIVDDVQAPHTREADGLAFPPGLR